MTRHSAETREAVIEAHARGASFDELRARFPKLTRKALLRWTGGAETETDAPAPAGPDSMVADKPAPTADRIAALLGSETPVAGGDEPATTPTETWTDERRDGVADVVEMGVGWVDAGAAQLAGIAPKLEKPDEPLFSGKLKKGERAMVRSMAPKIEKAWNALLDKSGEWSPEKTLLVLAGVLVGPRVAAALVIRFGKKKAPVADAAPVPPGQS